MQPDAEKLIALEAELRRDLDAIERVKRLMAFKNGSLSPPDDRQYRLPVPLPEDLGEDDAEVGPVKSLIGTVEQIMNSDPSVRWTTAKTLARLQHLGFSFKAKRPVFSVGQAIQKLVEKGRIRVVRHGSGNTPNIYKGKAPPNESAEDLGGQPELPVG
jgi:hypothetical protein